VNASGQSYDDHKPNEFWLLNRCGYGRARSLAVLSSPPPFYRFQRERVRLAGKWHRSSTCLAIKTDDYEQANFHDHEGLLAATNMSLNV
jgi:hypothetical protein